VDSGGFIMMVLDIFQMEQFFASLELNCVERNPKRISSAILIL